MREVAKAIAAGAAALIGGLLLVITGSEGLGDVTVAGTVLGAYGFTWAVPNRSWVTRGVEKRLPRRAHIPEADRFDAGPPLPTIQVNKIPFTCPLYVSCSV